MSIARRSAGALREPSPPPGGPKILEPWVTGVGMPQSEIAQALQTNVIAGLCVPRVLKDFSTPKVKYVSTTPWAGPFPRS